MKNSERIGIIIHGAPGSGKGFITEKYIEQYPNIDHISVGNHVRDIAGGRVQSQFKGQVDFASRKKLLLSDDVSAEIVEERIQASDKSIHIIDGFPQRPGELEHFLGQTRMRLLGIVTLQVCEATAVKRMEIRGLRQGETTDFDVIEYYHQRYRRYTGQYRSLLEALDGRLPVETINAENDHLVVYDDFQTVANSLLGREREG